MNFCIVGEVILSKNIKRFSKKLIDGKNGIINIFDVWGRIMVI